MKCPNVKTSTCCASSKESIALEASGDKQFIETNYTTLQKYYNICMWKFFGCNNLPILQHNLCITDGCNFTNALYYQYMKRTISTIVLFVLLILTVVAITQLGDPSST